MLYLAAFYTTESEVCNYGAVRRAIRVISFSGDDVPILLR